MSELSQMQQMAVMVSTNEPVVMVIAGPGSGKTRVLIERIAYLVKLNVPPSDICAVTFTNKAARVIEQRLKERGIGPLGYVGTIHGLCYRILVRHGGWAGYGPGLTVLDEAQSDARLFDTAKLCGYGGISLTKLKVLRDQYGPKISVALTKEALVVASYYKGLRRQNATDYQGLLVEAARTLETDSGLKMFRFLFCDEYQDISQHEARVFAALNLQQRFLVGDPDQAIYGFRGGEISHILQAAGAGNEYLLEANYRSAPAICHGANNLIRHNTRRVQKNTEPMRGKVGVGKVEVAHYRSAGEELLATAGKIQALLDCGTPPNEIAVLARTNAIAGDFRNMARSAFDWRLEDERSDEATPDAPYARALLALAASPNSELAAELWIQADSSDPEAAARIKQHAAREQKPMLYFFRRAPAIDRLSDVATMMRQYNCTAASIARIIGIIETLPEDATLADLVLAERADEGERWKHNGISITTMHSAKGREWKSVFLIGLEQETIPGKTLLPDDLEEERRVMYVAVTRAKDELYLSSAATRTQPFGKREAMACTPSQFIAEIRSEGGLE